MSILFDPPKPVDEMLAEYTELMNRFGPDSDEARACFDAYSEDEEFAELAKVARDLKIAMGGGG